MKTLENPINYSFTAFSTFIEYKKKLAELKTSLHVKSSSIIEARKTIDTYIKPSHKLSNDVIKMREE